MYRCGLLIEDKGREEGLNNKCQSGMKYTVEIYSTGNKSEKY